MKEKTDINFLFIDGSYDGMEYICTRERCYSLDTEFLFFNDENTEAFNFIPKMLANKDEYDFIVFIFM